METKFLTKKDFRKKMLQVNEKKTEDVMLNSNQPIKVAHLQKLANHSMLNDALVTEMAKNSFSKS